MPLVTFKQEDQLGEIVIDNPPLNLFNADVLSDLRSAVDQAAHSDIRAVLVRAEGSDFSAGADISVFTDLDQAGADELEETVLALIAAIEALPVPALALIHGQCYAGALEVCLGCDLIWAAEASRIGQIEAVAGGIPYAGGTQTHRIADRRLARCRDGIHRSRPAAADAGVLGPHQPGGASGQPHRRRPRFRPESRERPHACARRHQARAARLALRRSGRGRRRNPGRGTDHHDERGPERRPLKPCARWHRPRHLPQQMTLAQLLYAAIRRGTGPSGQ